MCTKLHAASLCGGGGVGGMGRVHRREGCESAGRCKGGVLEGCREVMKRGEVM